MAGISDKSWFALLLAVAATTAEVDAVPYERRTTENILRRVEWWLENPYRDLPSMLIDDEVQLQKLLQRFRADVHFCQAKFSELPPPES